MTTATTPSTNGTKDKTVVVDLTALKDQAAAVKRDLAAAVKAEDKAARRVERTSAAHNEATAELDRLIARRRALTTAKDEADDAVRQAQRRVKG